MMVESETAAANRATIGAADTAPFKPGDQIRELTILEKVGQGAMGVVYLAVHRVLKTKMALKVLPSFLAKRKEFRDRFLLEAETLAKLRHPNIVGVNDFGVHNGHHYLVLEFIEGGNIEDYLAANGGRLPPAEVQRIIYDLLQGLSFAHRKGIVHRDLKPANMLLDLNHNVKISDFGLAKVLGTDFQSTMVQSADLTRTRIAQSATDVTGGVMGTYDFMSPEARTGRAVDAQSDIYAVGVITYYLLTGSKPIARSKAPSALIRKLNPKWDRFIDRCLEPLPQDRFKVADDALEALAELAPRARRGLSWAMGITAALVFLLVGAYAWLSQAGIGPILQALGLAPPPPPQTQPVQSEPTAEEAQAAAEFRDQQLLRDLRDERTVSPDEYIRLLEALFLETDDPRRDLAEQVVRGILSIAEWREQTAPEPEPEAQPDPDPTVELLLPGDIPMRFALIPAGTYMMGSPPSEPGRRPWEEQRSITIPRPYYMGITEVTQEQYMTLMASNPSGWRAWPGSEHFPIDQVKFDEILGQTGFITRLNKLLQEMDHDGFIADLPTEEEWEYACRAGTVGPFNDGSQIPDSESLPNLEAVANYGRLYGHPIPVAQKSANAWGLFDMHGNVAEMTLGVDNRIVVRGGSFRESATHLRCASRKEFTRNTAPANDHGFRILLRIVEPDGEPQ